MESVNCDLIIKERQSKLDELKSFLNKVEQNLLSITEDLKWDYSNLQKELPSTLVTCSINNQHRVPISSIESHEEKCSWHQKGYHDYDKPFSVYSGQGSSITLNEELLNKITAEVTLADVCFFNVILGLQTNYKNYKSVPETSANLDQNFSREEKLAIYDYVIANTKKQDLFSDLCLQPLEKKEEKKEMTSWEIAAALRDAKRRRASYRNKVHTNRKTHTEILREVIDVQMESLKDKFISQEVPSPSSKKTDHHSKEKKKKNSKHEREEKKYSNHDSVRKKDKEDEKKSRKHHKHSKHRNHRSNKSPQDVGSDLNSRSRLNDKHRKWKKYEGRSHYHKSSMYQHQI